MLIWEKGRSEEIESSLQGTGILKPSGVSGEFAGVLAGI